MHYDIQICDVSAQPTAVVRTRARLSELSTLVPQGCGAAWDYARAAKLPKPGHNIALYRDGTDGEVIVEAGAEVSAAFEGNGHVIAPTLPGGRVATTAIHDYCAKHGLDFEGTSWEIYEHRTDNEEELRTDVFYLLTKCIS